MLKRRLIPRFLARNSTSASKNGFEVCVSQNYSNLKMIGSLKSQLRICESNKADELLVVNTTKSLGAIDPEFIKEIAESIQILSTPIMVGGGINSLDDASALVAVGVDKILCGVSRFNPELYTEIVNCFGSQALTISIDYTISENSILIGSSTKTVHDAESFRSLIRRIEESGAGEIILNRIDYDGTKQGLDLETLHLVLSCASVPVIASAGAGKLEHFVSAFEAGADGVAVGTYFAKMDQSPLQLRSRLFNAGVRIRA